MEGRSITIDVDVDTKSVVNKINVIVKHLSAMAAELEALEESEQKADEESWFQKGGVFSGPVEIREEHPPGQE